MLQEPSQRATELMRSARKEERKASRVHLTLPASISCPAKKCKNRLAIMRDLSTAGAFFYTELDADTGAAITLQFVLSGFGKSIRMICKGKIVRVEQFPRGAATGFAVEFERCDMRPGEVS